MKLFQINFTPTATNEQKLTYLESLEKSLNEQKTRKQITIACIISAIASILYILFGEAVSFSVLGKETSLKFSELATAKLPEAVTALFAFSNMIYIPYLISVVLQSATLYFIVKSSLMDKNNNITLIVTLIATLLALALFVGSIYCCMAPSVYANSYVKPEYNFFPAIICFALLFPHMFILINLYKYRTLKQQIISIRATLTK